MKWYTTTSRKSKMPIKLLNMANWTSEIMVVASEEGNLVKELPDSQDGDVVVADEDGAARDPAAKKAAKTKLKISAHTRENSK